MNRFTLGEPVPSSGQNRKSTVFTVSITFVGLDEVELGAAVVHVHEALALQDLSAGHLEELEEDEAEDEDEDDHQPHLPRHRDH